MANLTSKPVSSNAHDVKALLLAQKTELVSELTRVMANQFNNTMMAVTSYAELEMKRLAPAERRSLEQILKNATKATALVQKLLGISRNQTGSPEALNLNSALTEIKVLVEQLTGEHISVVYSLDSSIPAVFADPTEIEQLVLCLTINARNAMVNGGTVTVTTRPERLTADFVRESEKPGDYVMLSVDDSEADGTKPLSERFAGADQDSRMSLSLAAVRAALKSAGGVTRFSTDPETGNSFRVYFPVLRQDAKLEEDRTTPRKVAVARTILIVEDDDAVRVPTSELLKMEGFKVLQARTGEEAIHIVEQNHPTLDILITDIVMPKMTGYEVAAKLLELHPGLKVLYMSGDAQEGLSSPVERTPGPALRKPFRLDVLKDKIHELLGE
jgi:two-component system cell cycle sensor histidine kinase/response regulator CckA